MAASMNATDRVATLREDYARLGENVDHLSDAELLFCELDRSRAESRRHENAYSSLVQDQVKHDRSVYAAARREAQENRLAWGGIYLMAILRQSMGPINEVLHRIEQLPDRPGVKQMDAVKDAARRANWILRGVTARDAEAARGDEQVQLVEKYRSEILRLRDFINGQAGRLHTDHGRDGGKSNNWRCECPGCELIRAMDDVPAEQAA